MELRIKTGSTTPRTRKPRLESTHCPSLRQALRCSLEVTLRFRRSRFILRILQAATIRAERMSMSPSTPPTKASRNRALPYPTRSSSPRVSRPIWLVPLPQAAPKSHRLCPQSAIQPPPLSASRRNSCCLNSSSPIRRAL